MCDKFQNFVELQIGKPIFIVPKGRGNSIRIQMAKGGFCACAISSKILWNIPVKYPKCTCKPSYGGPLNSEHCDGPSSL